MPTLLLRFPARRYHATPWGYHVNEGQIEWPPSPWRLLRALIATGYSTQQWLSGDIPFIARSLLEKLAGVLPRYRLPAASGAHSRHYMPLAKFKNGREDTTLVFDAWAQIDKGEIAVIWDAELSDDESALFSLLVENVGYIGRSESWVIARVAEPRELLPDGSDCFPVTGERHLGKGWEQVSLMVPLATGEYNQWRQSMIEEENGQIEKKNGGKKTPKEIQKIEDSYAADLLACLQVTTDWIRGYGWSRPPGSQRVLYWRRSDSLESSAPKPVRQPHVATTVESILLSISNSSGQDHALPTVFRTLAQAELLHRVLVKAASRGDNLPGSVLTGCDDEEKPLSGPHRHAHIIPIDLDADGHLDHILLWAPMGFNLEAQSAIRSIRTTYMKGGSGSLRLILAGIGSLEQIQKQSGDYGANLRLIVNRGGGCSTWISATPFVPPRYLKKNGKNTIEGQVIAELESRGFPAPEDIRVILPNQDPQAAEMRHFLRTRRFGRKPPIDAGFFITLKFSRPIEGPLCLGYGSHFGLGLFKCSR